MGGIENLMKQMCGQTALYWDDPVEDGYGGKTFSSASPIEISCRWEKDRQIYTNDKAEELISNAIVYVTQDLDEGGYLYLGDLDDLDSADEESNPKDIDGAFEIKRFDKTPSLGSTTEFVRKAYL